MNEENKKIEINEEELTSVSGGAVSTEEAGTCSKCGAQRSFMMEPVTGRILGVICHACGIWKSYV